MLWLAAVAVAAMLCGCAHIDVPVRNVVMFNENGRLLDPTGTIACEDPPALCRGRHLSLVPYPELNEEQREPYLREVLAGLNDAPRGPDREGKKGKRRLLLFVHGGLNTQKQSVQRVVDLAPGITKAGYHPLFVNWRSSLVSSYFDHAFFIRQGEEWKVFGPLTAPFVIAADIGRSLVRAPLVWGSQLQGGCRRGPASICPMA